MNRIQETKPLLLRKSTTIEVIDPFCAAALNCPAGTYWGTGQAPRVVSWKACLGASGPMRDIRCRAHYYAPLPGYVMLFTVSSRTDDTLVFKISGCALAFFNCF